MNDLVSEYQQYQDATTDYNDEEDDPEMEEEEAHQALMYFTRSRT